MLKRITTNLMVEDVAKTIRFYEDVLGFQTLTTVPGTDEGELGFAIVRRDAVELMFQSRKSLSENVPALTGAPIGASQTLFIDVENIDNLYRQLQGKVTIVVDMHTTFYSTKEFYFRDINGYILSFAESLDTKSAEQSGETEA
jgi:lactoylglutathione lyase